MMYVVFVQVCVNLNVNLTRHRGTYEYFAYFSIYTALPIVVFPPKSWEENIILEKERMAYA